MNEYCCETMNEELESQKVAIGYNEKFRTYYIHLQGSKNGSCRIDYCPWCSSKLPTPLDEKYDEFLSKAIKIPVDEITLQTYQSKKIPPEFKTDEWWKKRRL